MLYFHAQETCTIANQALSQEDVAEIFSLLNVNEALFFVNIHVQYQKRIAFILHHPLQTYENANNFPEIDLGKHLELLLGAVHIKVLIH